MQVLRRKRQKHDLVCKNFFFAFLFLCQSHSQVEVPFFFFFFSSISVSDCFTLIILENFRSKGGQVPPRPPLAPPVHASHLQSLPKWKTYYEQFTQVWCCQTWERIKYMNFFFYVSYTIIYFKNDIILIFIVFLQGCS